MEKNKKYIKIIGIILLSCLLLFVIGFVISQFTLNTLTEESANAPISNNETEKADTFEDDMQKIKQDFSSSEIAIVDTKCNAVENALESMLQTLILNDKISSKWSPSCYSHYSELYSDNYYYISFNCDIDDIKSNEEMKEIIKDCSQIIWESVNLIYSNPNINNDKDKIFSKLDYNFSFNYSYIDNFGNTKYSHHNLYFDLTRYSYNKINKETFPSILALDYTKIFGIGTATYSLGSQGIEINFKNLLTK